MGGGKKRRGRKEKAKKHAEHLREKKQKRKERKPNFKRPQEKEGVRIACDRNRREGTIG